MLYYSSRPLLQIPQVMVAAGVPRSSPGQFVPCVSGSHVVISSMADQLIEAAAPIPAAPAASTMEHGPMISWVSVVFVTWPVIVVLLAMDTLRVFPMRKVDQLGGAAPGAVVDVGIAITAAVGSLWCCRGSCCSRCCLSSGRGWSGWSLFPPPLSI